MRFFENLRLRMTAMRLGLSIIGEGIFKAPGQGLLSNLGQLLQPRWGEPPRRSAQQWIELYGKSPRLRPIYRIAKDVAKTDWKLYINRGKQEEQILEHPLINLLKRPNPRIRTGHTLWYLTAVWLLLRGEGGWLIERNGLRVPAELWPIPPHWVQDTPSVGRPYFTVVPLNTVGISLKIDEKDMVWFFEPDPANPYGRGLGSAEGIGDEVETDEYMAKWAKRFFFNDAKPPVVLQAPGISKEQAERLKEEWMERYAGYHNAHKPAVLPWDAKIQELGKPQREMDFVESRKFLRDIAHQHWFMPPELLGIHENSNRSTIDAAYYLYSKGTLSWVLDLIEDHIQMQLCPEFDPNLVFRFDDPVPEDKEFKLKVANDGLKGGALKVNEWRQANGFDPDPGADIYYVPRLAMPQRNLGGKKPPENEEEGKQAKGLTPEQNAAIWRMFDKGAVKHEAAFRRAAKKFFQEQQNQVNQRLEDLFGEKAISPSDFENVINVIELLLDWNAQNDKLKGVLTAVWLASWKEGWQMAESLWEFGVSWDLLNPRFLDWVDTYGADQVKGINGTTKQALRRELYEGLQNGESVPQLRERVSAVFAEAKGVRSEAIARTESHNSVSAGTFETYRAADVGRKEWLTTIDGRERPSHAALDGEQQPINQPFSNGLMYPGAPGPASEVINCRCALLPVVE